MYGFRIEYTEDGGKITLQPREAGLAGLYKLTDCQMVEVAGVGTLGGVKVALLCDEEGLLKANPTNNLTACDLLAEMSNSAPAYLNGGGLAGTCSLVADDNNLRGLTADEVAKITKALDKGGYPYGNSTFNMLGIEVNVIRAF
jgi:hypothetical protein